MTENINVTNAYIYFLLLSNILWLIPNYRVTSACHVGSSRWLVTSARQVGSSRSAVQYLFTPINAMLVCAVDLSWLHIGDLVSKSAQGITSLSWGIAGPIE